MHSNLSALYTTFSQASYQLFILSAGLLGLCFVVVFHELGHFLFCKLFGIHTPSFSIGFGPKLISRMIGRTEFSLSAIPLGGYVEVAGSAEVGQGKQEEAHSTADDSFSSKPFYQKLLVMLGGIGFNIAFAYAAFIILCMIGLPEAPLTVGSVIENSAADHAHIKAGDRLISIKGVLLQDNPSTAINIIQASADQQVPIIIEREGTQQELMVTIGSKEETEGTKPVGSLGVFFSGGHEKASHTSLWEDFKHGITLTNRLIINTVSAFLSILKKRDTSKLGGPLMIISQTMKGAEAGLKMFLILLALISINLAVLNLLPLPILDGGQILFLFIEGAIGRPVPIKIREYIHITCWIGFLLLSVYLLIKDASFLSKGYFTK